MPNERSEEHSSLFQRTRNQRLLRTLPRLLALLAVLSLTGCVTSFREYVGNGFKVGPNYGRPEAAVANHWIDYEDKRIQSDAEADYAWWRQFGDPRLDSLVYTGTPQNLTLREAAFRVMEARAIRGIAVGELFPQSQTVSGAYTRRRTSFGTGIQAGGGAGLPGIKQHFSVWNSGTQFAWEVDFWGRFRRAIEAADAARRVRRELRRCARDSDRRRRECVCRDPHG